MAIRNYECWKCHFDFHAHDTLPCSVDHKCPRCGVGVRKWIPSKEDKIKGTYRYDPSSSLVLRTGREKQQLFVHGYYQAIQRNGEIIDVEVLDAYTPRIG